MGVYLCSVVTHETKNWRKDRGCGRGEVREGSLCAVVSLKTKIWKKNAACRRSEVGGGPLYASDAPDEEVSIEHSGCAARCRALSSLSPSNDRKTQSN